MRLVMAMIGSLALTACSTVTEREMLSASADLVIRNVTVIDPQTRTVRADSDVFVDNGRIVEIADTGSSMRTADQLVPGDDRFLIPGLMDMHTHTSFRPVHENSLALLLANGVTGVREMGSDCMGPPQIFMCIDDMRASQARIAAGDLIGPRIFELSSSKVDSNRPDGADEMQSLYRPLTAMDGERSVAYLAGRGVDFLKTGEEFTPEAFTGFATSAREHGMRFGGHVPPYLSVAEVAGMGMASIEHARDLPLDCSDYGPVFRAAVQAVISGDSEDWPDRLQTPARARDSFNEARCDAQIAAMLQSGTYYVPTHLTREMDFRAGEDAYRNDPRLSYIIALQRESWVEDMDRTVQRMGDMRGDLQDFFRLGLRTTAMAHAAGVPIMAGTDANDTMVFPGFSLHDELRHLVAAGLSPMEALRAATSVPAIYLNRSDEFGGVAVGRMADLVLLEADPLADIANTTAIAAVFFGGTYRDRAALDQILAGVRASVAAIDEEGLDLGDDD